MLWDQAPGTTGAARVSADLIAPWRMGWLCADCVGVWRWGCVALLSGVNGAAVVVRGSSRGCGVGGSVPRGWALPWWASVGRRVVARDGAVRVWRGVRAGVVRVLGGR